MSCCDDVCPLLCCSLQVSLRPRSAQAASLQSLPVVLLYAQHGWSVSGGYVVFQGAGSSAMPAGGKPEVPSMQLIHNSLMYAKELERIV